MLRENPPHQASGSTWAEKLPPDFKRGLSDHATRALIALGNAPKALNRDRPEFNPFKLPEFPTSVVPSDKKMQLGMDEALCDSLGWATQQWAGLTYGGLASEGLVFPGYAFLSQLAVRPEYRIASETIADEMTRKWIRFRGVGENPGEKDDDDAGQNDLDALENEVENDLKRTSGKGEHKPGGARTVDKSERIKELVDFMDHMGVKDAYYAAALGDGLFGRMHLFHEISGNDGSTPEGLEELKSELGDGRGNVSKSKVGPEAPLTGIRAVEPIWTYPTTYGAINPIRRDFYNPQVWYTNGQQIHVSRLFRFVGRPVPDLLKPSFSFGGQSLSQMGTPYVDIWLETRQSIARLIHSFSVMGISTDMQAILQDPNLGAAGLLARIQAANMTRDNQGLWVLNKNTEEFWNVQASLAGLHELQAQAQEHMSIPAGVMIETARGSIPIEHVTINDMVLTRDGFAPVQWAGITGSSNELVEIEAAGTVLRTTGNHPIWSESTSEFVNAENVSPSHHLLALKTKSRVNTASRSHGEAVGGAAPSAGTIATLKQAAFCIASCGKLIAALFQTVMSFITRTTMAAIMSGQTLSLSPDPFTRSSTAISPSSGYRIRSRAFAKNAATNTRLSCSETPSFADHAEAVPIERVRAIKVPRQPVYDIVVADGWSPEFYANGILVHNCSVWRIPAVKFTGLQPTGLNASSEGEITVFQDTIKGMQERVMRAPLTRTVRFCMLSLWGEVDEDIVFDFVPLDEMDEKERAEIQKLKAERDDLLMNGCQAIGPTDVRKRLAADPESDFDDIDPDEEPDLPEPPPGAEGEGGAGGGKIDLKGNERAGAGGGGEDERPFGFTSDADPEWKEADHPRGPDGKFGSGGASAAPAAKPAKPAEKTYPWTPKPLAIGRLNKIGPQLGSNEGGQYENDKGERFYIKKGKTAEHVKSELLAAKLFREAGGRTLKYVPVEGGEHIATKWEKADKNNIGKFSEAERAQARRDFARHAWLANWDAAGLENDNYSASGGKTFPNDLGGSLEWRAQGSPKGAAFGDKADEWNTLRDPNINSQNAALFAGMTQAELRRSALDVALVPDDTIRKAVEKAGKPKAMADKLIARKRDIEQRANGDPKDADNPVTFDLGAPLPVKELNGMAFKAWDPPQDWAQVDGTVPELDADAPMEVPEGKTASSGVLMIEPDGRVWLMRPANKFGGYNQTIPKGGVEKGLTPQQNAIKEVYEETGLKARILDVAGDIEGDTTMTRYYVGMRDGGDPSQHEWEASAVVLAPQSALRDYLNRSRDTAVTKHVLGHDEALALDEKGFKEADHPRDEDGKFTSGGGGGAGSVLEKIKQAFGKPVKSAGESGPLTVPAGKTKKAFMADVIEKGVPYEDLKAALGWNSVGKGHTEKMFGKKIETSFNEKGQLIWKFGGAKETVNQPLEFTGEMEGVKSVLVKNAKGEFAVTLWDTDADQQIGGQKIFNDLELAGNYAKALVHAKEEPVTTPQASPDDLAKAKKATGFYAPNGVPPSMEAKVKEFDAKYAGKTLTDPDALNTKVAEYKALKAEFDQAFEAEKAAIAAKQEEAAGVQKKAQQAANRAAAEALKKEQEGAKAKNAEYMKALGISETEAVGFNALVSMIGGNGEDLVKTFQGYAKEAEKHGYPITGFQYALCKNYIDSGYAAVNGALRKGTLTQAQHVYTKLVNDALEKMPKYTGTVTRGTSLEPSQIAAYVPGHVIEERAFTSTGVGYKFGGNVSYKIKSIGKRGGDFSTGANKGEKEVLFKAHTFFLVHSVKKVGSVTHIEMEEVEHHG